MPFEQPAPSPSEFMPTSVLDDLVHACDQHRGGAPSDALVSVTSAFLGRVNDDRELLGRAATHLQELPPRGAAWLAITLGTAVEQGADPQVSGPHLVALLELWLSRLPEVRRTDDDDDSNGAGSDDRESNGAGSDDDGSDDAQTDEDEDEDEDIPDPTPEQDVVIEAFPMLCQSLVAHLARTPELRESLAKNIPLLDRLEDAQHYSYGATWVREALLRTSGRLIALHPLSGRALELHVSNVANCFHLFTLVQGAIGERLPEGRKPNEAALAVARGGDGDLQDEAWWHFGDPISPTADIAGSIWGESLVRSMPLIHGARVVVLWPPVLGSRSWNTGLFGPHLDAMPANVTFERELDPKEARKWFGRVDIAVPN